MMAEYHCDSCGLTVSKPIIGEGLAERQRHYHCVKCDRAMHASAAQRWEWLGKSLTLLQSASQCKPGVGAAMCMERAETYTHLARRNQPRRP